MFPLRFACLGLGACLLLAVTLSAALLELSRFLESASGLSLGYGVSRLRSFRPRLGF